MSDLKIDQAKKKIPFFLIPLWLLTGLARVFAYGAKKYKLGNWYQANLGDGSGERYVSALLRHVAFLQTPGGEVTKESLGAVDEESGLPHLDHAICSLIMLRGIAVKGEALQEDPGEGKEPPAKIVVTANEYRVEVDSLYPPSGVGSIDGYALPKFNGYTWVATKDAGTRPVYGVWDVKGRRMIAAGAPSTPWSSPSVVYLNKPWTEQPGKLYLVRA